MTYPTHRFFDENFGDEYLVSGQPGNYVLSVNGGDFPITDDAAAEFMDMTSFEADCD